MLDSYLEKKDWTVSENASQTYSLSGLSLYCSQEQIASHMLTRVYPQKVSQAHISCAIHIHDLGVPGGYCTGWSLRQLIQRGICGVAGKTSVPPAETLGQILSQTAAFLSIMQNEWAGAQALSSFDTYLAPYIKKESLTQEQVHTAVEAFIYSMNMPSRSGTQPPFTNITLDWMVPPDLADKRAVCGKLTMDFTYAECQKEMDMLNRALLEVYIQGDSQGRGFEYPIPTYNIGPDFDFDGTNAKLLFTLASKYGTPYFQNFINSELNPGDVRAMCCRLRLDKRELRRRGSGLFGSDEFTGSIGVVTVNMPQLGLLSHTRDEFFRRLLELMETAK